MEPTAPKLPPKPLREQAKVLYAYDAQNEDELTIKEGDIINVISKEIEDQGWFKGELNGKIGVFPDNFVELIKVPVLEEDKPLPPRPTKTSNVTSSPSAISALVSALGKNKSSSTVTDGNSQSNGSKTASDQTAPPASVKTSIFGLKKSNKSSSTSIVSSSKTSSSVKPDIVPHESSSNLNESASSTASSSAANNESVSGIEGLGASTASSKLNHLTANRAKGPSNRRPPSYVSSNNNTSPSKEPLNSQENGVEKTNGSSVTPSLIRATSVTSDTSSIKSVTSTTTGVTSPGSKGKEDPPWMVELRKTQEAKKGLKTGTSFSNETSTHAPHLQERSVSLDSSSSADGSSAPIASNRLVAEKPSPVVSSSSPNRTSGDFSSRVGQFNGGSSSSESSSAPPVSILKPQKPIKPPIGSTIVSSSTTAAANNNHNNSSSPSVTPSSANNSLTSKTAVAAEVASSSPKGSVSEVTSTPTTSTSGVSSSCLTDLQKELKSLKECTVSRKEFDDLAKQVRECNLILLSMS